MNDFITDDMDCMPRGRGRRRTPREQMTAWKEYLNARLLFGRVERFTFTDDDEGRRIHFFYKSDDGRRCESFSFAIDTPTTALIEAVTPLDRSAGGNPNPRRAMIAHSSPDGSPDFNTRP